MKGWLIVNGFIKSAKFTDLYELFSDAAEKADVRLEIKTSDSLVCATDESFSADLPDFILFWDKDVYLARRLESFGIPLFNSSRAVEVCDDKILTVLALGGKVPVPKTVIVPKTYEGIGYNDFGFLRRAIVNLGLPIVIKEAYGSFGQQVYLARSFEEAEEMVSRIGYKPCLIQKFISSSCGRDVRINVVGGKVVASMLRYNERDFRSNVSGGGKTQPFCPSEEQKEVAVDACEILGLDFAGVDVLFGENGVSYVCEVNSNPHFKSTLDCTGINLAPIILGHIKDKIR